MSAHVFSDPEQKRWRKFKIFLHIAGILIFLGFCTLLASILINPSLPSLGLSSIAHLPSKKHTAILPLTSHTTYENKLSTSQKLLSELHEKHKNHTKISEDAPGEVLGFFVNWEDTSFTSLKQNINTLDSLAPEWLHLQSDKEKIDIMQDMPECQKEVRAYIRNFKPSLQVFPLINNYNSEKDIWDADLLQKALGSAENRTFLIENLLSYVENTQTQGITLDFENINSDTENDVTLFVTELSSAFHEKNLRVYITIPADDSDFPYENIADTADKVILMAYDEHWSSSAPGSIASQDWFENILEKRLKTLPSEKTIVALANYSYDWPDGTSQATSLSFQDTITLASESEGDITMDNDSLNPHFDYYDDNDKLHHVWMLDAATAFNQVSASRASGAAGVALWRLGGEDPDIWNIFKKSTLDSKISPDLVKYSIGYEVNYTGSGEILKMTSPDKSGERSLEFAKDTPLITDEHYTNFPLPYTITRWGEKAHTVALTFDDGPDPEYTPKILDILKAEKVPGTFFIIGSNAENNPDILRRVINEGNEIGNHTYFHPNVAEISSRHLKLELNTTERLLESITGRSTVLFRPPYAEDLEPDTPDQMQPLVVSSDLGYYTVGMHIDPGDWKKPGVDTIINNTIQAAEAGKGSIILLHDAGGDRSETVLALPKIIQELKKRGYQFVKVSSLVGLTSNQVMPKVDTTDKIISSVNDATFSTLHIIGNILYFLFFIGIILGILRFIFLLSLSLLHYFQKKKSASYTPTVSIIIPAYNEEKVIGKTILSVAKSIYPHFEIVVVDDGSKDTTYEVARNLSTEYKNIQVFKKENGGKSSAINFGIQHTKNEIIIVIDADTVFAQDTVGTLCKHFAESHIGAVAGNVKVGNRNTIITKWQAIEYITSQNLDRRAFDLLNAITVVPGAIGAWRRSVLLEVGGFKHDTLAEDADVTMSILRLGYHIKNDPFAHAFTEAPDTVKGFLKQRFRWTFGTLQVAWKHKDALFKPKYKSLGLIALPNIFIFQVFFALIAPIVDTTMLFTILSSIYEAHYYPTTYSPDALLQTLYFYTLFIVIDFCTALIAFTLEKREEWTLLPWLFLQRLLYRQLMYYVAAKAVYTAIKGKVVGWGHLERKGTVTLK